LQDLFMNQAAAADRVTIPQDLWDVYSPVHEDLQAVDDAFRRELHSDHPFVDQLVKHGLRLGGKRLRPALLLLAGQACGSVGEEHVTLATAVEMIHTASLVHDDVLDEATLRRHLATVNARWDNETSVLLGDYLFARSLAMVSSLDDAVAFREISQASQQMCEGELLQVANRGNYALAETCYLRIVTGKTAALIECCGRLGAHFAGAGSEVTAALGRYGLCLGIAFQIADDLLDVLGDEATVGKSLGTDLLKQKSTLPVIRLLDQAAGDERSEILSLLTRSGNHRREALETWWNRSDAICYTREKARCYARQAADALGILPPSAAAEALRRLAEFVVRRDR
jgi:octaprenyl-diphosphate synthase